MKCFILVISFLHIILLSPKCLHAQDAKVVITVSNLDGEAIPNALVLVKHGSQSAKFLFTDSLGKATFPTLATGPYQFSIQHIAYENVHLTRDLKGQETSIDLTLKQAGNRLEDVFVVAEKPWIQRKSDKLIIQIEGRSGLGNSAMEVLENAPGVLINNDAISFLDKGVEVRINDRPVKLTGQQLSNLLRNKTSASIKAIELDMTPGAELEADKDLRIINIKTIKNEDAGYSAGVSARMVQRSTSPGISTGLDVYGSTGKVSMFGYVGYYYDPRIEVLTTERQLIGSQSFNAMNERGEHNYYNHGPDYNIGLDYFFNDRSVAGIQYSGYSNAYNSRLEGISNLITNNTVDSLTLLEEESKNNSYTHNFNLNFSHKTDTIGSNLNFDIDHDTYNSNYLTDQVINTYFPSGINTGSPATTRNRGSENNANLFGMKLDYVKKFSGGQLSSGVKFSNANIEYDLDQRIENGSIIRDVDDILDYRENVFALYSSYRGNWGVYKYRLGLRAEATNYKGNTAQGTSGVEDNYFNIFPNVLVSREFEKGHYSSVSLSRKIRRPRFGQLIPFKNYISTYQYYTGNPDLRSYHPISAEVYYSYNNSYFANAGFSRANNRLLEFSTYLPATNEIEDNKENNGFYESLRFGGGYNGKITNWLRLNSGLSYSNGKQSIELGAKEDITDYSAYSLYLSPTANFAKTWRANLNFYYSSDVYYSVSRNLSYWYFGSQLSKSLFNGKGSVSFSTRDLFLTGITREESRYGNVDNYLENDWDSRQFILSFNYSFGSGKVKPKRKRDGTANNDVRGRTGG